MAVNRNTHKVRVVGRDARGHYFLAYRHDDGAWDWKRTEPYKGDLIISLPSNEAGETIFPLGAPRETHALIGGDETSFIDGLLP